MTAHSRTYILLLICTFLAAVALSQDADDFDTDLGIEIEDDNEIPSLSTPQEAEYKSPIPLDLNTVYFAEDFDDDARFRKRWIKSQAKKDGMDEDIAKYDGRWEIEPSVKDAIKGDLGLVLKTKAKHAAISALLAKPFIFTGKPLVVQYEVKLQEGMECGGAYLKLLSSGQDAKNLANFNDKSQYTIMFGPDKCGIDYKLHFIFKHKNPLNGTVEEKHCKKPKERLEEYFDDRLPHLYTLILRPDNSFEMRVDNKVVNSGTLLEDFNPAVNPPAEIDDPEDKKPEDWDEREKIPDPNAVKPSDWDEDAPAQIADESALMPEGWLEEEPSHIPDPNASKPADWDSEMDGDWEPPLIDNPACADAPGCGPWERPLINNPDFKGKWRAALVDNPNYKGKWTPARIANPDYFEDKEPFKMHTIVALGFELWSMSKDIYFDNIIITDDINVANKWAEDTFDKKRQKIAKDSVTMWGRIMKALNYRPKSWALYFVYCMIPVVLYIRYLLSWLNEMEKSREEKSHAKHSESFVQWLANITNDYPILWALYILVLGIPITFVLYLCCKPSSVKKPAEKRDLEEEARQKKTDDVTADDVAEEQPPIEEENSDKEKNSEPDSEGESEEVEEVDDNNKVPVEDETSDIPRKRKVRKE